MGSKPPYRRFACALCRAGLGISASRHAHVPLCHPQVPKVPASLIILCHPTPAAPARVMRNVRGAHPLRTLCAAEHLPPPQDIPRNVGLEPDILVHLGQHLWERMKCAEDAEAKFTFNGYLHMFMEENPVLVSARAAAGAEFKPSSDHNCSDTEGQAP